MTPYKQQVHTLIPLNNGGIKMNFKTPENHKHTPWNKGKLVGQKCWKKKLKNFIRLEPGEILKLGEIMLI